MQASWSGEIETPLMRGWEITGEGNGAVYCSSSIAVYYAVVLTNRKQTGEVATAVDGRE